VAEHVAEQFDRRLLAVLQQGLPLVRRPFAELAKELGCDERRVLRRIAFLRRRGGLIREIAGIFDPSALGYAQALVACRVEPGDLDAAGAVAGRHPGVSHCYARRGAYNLWFTLATSPQSRLGLVGTARTLAVRCRAASHMVLPAEKRYKLEVRFGQPSPAPVNRKPGRNRPSGPSAPDTSGRASPAELRAIRVLQQDLPACADPFAALAETARMDAEELLAHAAAFLERGWMRRCAAMLYHRRAGAAANVMVAWRVAPAGADAAGHKCAALAQVSHCFLRRTGQDWPYNLYTMIHGRSREDCAVAIDGLAAVTGLSERAELWTVKEYKKRRVLLFSGAEAEWEQDSDGPERARQ